jgi:hypothetical protein
LRQQRQPSMPPALVINFGPMSRTPRSTSPHLFEAGNHSGRIERTSTRKLSVLPGWRWAPGRSRWLIPELRGKAQQRLSKLEITSKLNPLVKLLKLGTRRCAT